MAFYFCSSSYSNLFLVSYDSPCIRISQNALCCQPYMHVNHQNVSVQRQLARAAPVTCASCVVATPVILQLRLSKYSRVSFCDGSLYDDSLLRPLSSRTEHSRLGVHHCRNSSVFSLISELLALFRCACVSSFFILFQCSSFKLIVIFPPMRSIKKDRKKKKSKQLTLHSFLMSSEPHPGPSSTK